MSMQRSFRIVQLALKSNPKSQFQTRSFFGGKNWDPFSELNTALRQVERNSREIEKTLQKIGRDVGLPTITFPRSTILKVNDNVHRISLDMSGFKPENVHVKLEENELTIKAQMDEKSEDGLQRISQNVTHQYVLPENTDVDNIKCLFSDDGLFVIEAPLLGNVSKQGPTEIPIERKTPPKDAK